MFDNWISFGGICTVFHVKHNKRNEFHGQCFFAHQRSWKAKGALFIKVGTQISVCWMWKATVRWRYPVVFLHMGGLSVKDQRVLNDWIQYGFHIWSCFWSRTGRMHVEQLLLQGNGSPWIHHGVWSHFTGFYWLVGEVSHQMNSKVDKVSSKSSPPHMSVPICVPKPRSTSQWSCASSVARLRFENEAEVWEVQERQEWMCHLTSWTDALYRPEMWVRTFWETLDPGGNRQD